MVVGYLAVVHQTLAGGQFLLPQRFDQIGISSHPHGFQTDGKSGYDIMAQITGIGPRIGDQFVLLVQVLQHGKGLLSRHI